MKTKIDGKLLAKALRMYLSALAVVGLILFLPAGSLKFWNAWLYLAVLFGAMFFVLIYLISNDPALLEKRLKTKEPEKQQKWYLATSWTAFLLIFILPGLDFRFHWSDVPVWLVILSTALVLAGYSMFFLVMKQNSYASRVVEIQEEQRLIDTGLYSVVRHPMYLAATIIFLFTPLVLGSFYAVIPALLIPFFLAWRISNEEKVLLQGLKGYDDYMKKVKYRLVPFVW